MNIIAIHSIADIPLCFVPFLELRPHLHSSQEFVDRVTEQQKEGYQISAIKQEELVVAVIGWRIMTTLAWGRILYTHNSGIQDPGIMCIYR